MEKIFGNIEQLIQQNPWLAVVAVFLGGVMTASNPCVLAIVPLMISFVAGKKGQVTIKNSFFFSLQFILGLSITFTILGIVSALMGRMFGDVGAFWRYAVVAVCLVMGIHLLGLFKFNFPFPKALAAERAENLGAFLLGLLFGAVSTPCAVPILAVLLAFIASKGNIFYGAFLLFIYALGHSFLILVAGTSMGAARRMIESKGLKKTNLLFQKIAGIIILLVGAYFLFAI